MTLDEKKELRIVVSVVVAVSLMVIISLVRSFNIYDFLYLIVCTTFLVKYVKLKTKK